MKNVVFNTKISFFVFLTSAPGALVSMTLNIIVFVGFFFCYLILITINLYFCVITFMLLKHIILNEMLFSHTLLMTHKMSKTKLSVHDWFLNQSTYQNNCSNTNFSTDLTHHFLQRIEQIKRCYRKNLSLILV
jgi:hypothetical protein